MTSEKLKYNVQDKTRGLFCVFGAIIACCIKILQMSPFCVSLETPPPHHIYVKICSSELKPNAHIQLAWRFTLNESVSNFILALAYCNILHRNGEALGSVSQAELQSFVMLEESPPTKPLFGTFLKTNV